MRRKKGETTQTAQNSQGCWPCLEAWLSAAGAKHYLQLPRHEQDRSHCCQGGSAARESDWIFSTNYWLFPQDPDLPVEDTREASAVVERASITSLFSA